MIVRRDNMGFASPNATTSVRPLGRPAIMPALPSSISSLTFQQREAMKREMWERERKAAMEKVREEQEQRRYGVTGGDTDSGMNSVMMQYQQTKYALSGGNGNSGGGGNTNVMPKTGELSWKVSSEQGKKYAWLEGLGWWETTV